jgi:hypothetical protein
MNEKMTAVIEAATDKQRDALDDENWLPLRYQHAHWFDRDGNRAFYGYFVSESHLRPGEEWWELRILYFASKPLVALRAMANSGYCPSIFGQKVVN